MYRSLQLWIKTISSSCIIIVPMLSESKKDPHSHERRTETSSPHLIPQAKAVLSGCHHHTTISPDHPYMYIFAMFQSHFFLYHGISKFAAEWKDETTTDQGKLHHLALGVSVWWSSCPCCHFQLSSCRGWWKRVVRRPHFWSYSSPDTHTCTRKHLWQLGTFQLTLPRVLLPSSSLLILLMMLEKEPMKNSCSSAWISCHGFLMKLRQKSWSMSSCP